MNKWDHKTPLYSKANGEYYKGIQQASILWGREAEKMIKIVGNLAIKTVDIDDFKLQDGNIVIAIEKSGKFKVLKKANYTFVWIDIFCDEILNNKTEYWGSLKLAINRAMNSGHTVYNLEHYEDFIGYMAARHKVEMEKI